VSKRRDIVGGQGGRKGSANLIIAGHVVSGGEESGGGDVNSYRGESVLPGNRRGEEGRLPVASGMREKRGMGTAVVYLVSGEAP